MSTTGGGSQPLIAIVEAAAPAVATVAVKRHVSSPFGFGYAKPVADFGDSRTVRIEDARAIVAAPAAYLTIVTECDRPLAPSSRHALIELDEADLGRGSGEQGGRAVHRGKDRRLRILVPDRQMSSSHAVLVRADRWWIVRDAGSTNGTYLNGARTEEARLTSEDVIEVGNTFLVFREGPRDPKSPLDVTADALHPADRALTTMSTDLAATYARFGRAAASALPLLLLGESGTGKEVLAKAAHALSGRGGDFVAVNCGAIPETLVERELFGHVKNAFTGATASSPGFIRAADGGTLFLDEIGDLPLPAQASLLRVLQEHEVTPIGATRPFRVDLRVVAATHRDLAAAVDRGAFRGDLYARLNGVIARLPPLRARRDDLGILLGELLRRVAPDRAERLTLSRAAARAIFRYRWPYNVRELEKCLAGAVAMMDDDHMGPEHLPDVLHEKPRDEAAPGRGPSPEPELWLDDEKLRARLVELLTEQRGNVSAIARSMGKDRMQIQRWLKRLKLDRSQFE